MELFERVKTIALAKFGSERKMAGVLGIAPQNLNRYMNSTSQKNLWDYLPRILQEHSDVSREWLYFGEGEMLKGSASAPESTQAVKPVAPTTILSSPVPVVGLASCGLEGMDQIMPYNITASPIALGPRAVAVVASGESMVPAGIASGHLCFCDPDQIALPGEAVFLRLRDEKGALKLFLGEGARAGYTKFQGWLSEKDDHGHQKGFILEQLTSQIDYIAPVIFIRRRL